MLPRIGFDPYEQPRNHHFFTVKFRFLMHDLYKLEIVLKLSIPSIQHTHHRMERELEKRYNQRILRGKPLPTGCIQNNDIHHIVITLCTPRNEMQNGYNR
eukprot:25513_1